MSVQVKGKAVLVTGSNRGIGRAIVDSVIRHGASKVWAAVRNLDSAAPLVDAYENRVVPILIDLERPKTITEASRVASDVQIVVTNAGVLRQAKALSEDAIERLQFEMEVNVHGLIRVARAFAPVLEANGGGAIVQLNSVASLKSFAGFATYSASKAAAYSITQALRDELAPRGIDVLSVHPGPIATDMADSAGLTDIAEPPSLVGEGIIDSLNAGEFHLFPDSLARQFGDAYRGFAENVVEANLSEA